MSKLKTAKAIRKSFRVAGTILKWVLIVFSVVGISVGLWAWANAHFISFASVIGVLLFVILIGTIGALWEWSGETIEQAELEEATEQARERAEKRREELNAQTPRVSRTIPDFDEYDYALEDESYGRYR